MALDTCSCDIMAYFSMHQERHCALPLVGDGSTFAIDAVFVLSLYSLMSFNLPAVIGNLPLAY